MLSIVRLISLAMIFSLSAIANAKECSDAENSINAIECYSARYVAADRALNAIYSKAMKELSTEEKSLLKASQLAWLKFRDASFAYVIESNKDSRSYGAIAVAEYKAKMVEKRVLELRYLLTGPEGPAVQW